MAPRTLDPRERPPLLRPHRSGPLLAGALSALLAAAGAYLYGLQRTLTFATDVQERCNVILGQPFDPAYGHRSAWPPSLRCNAGYDMVPSWLTPAVILLLVLGVLLGTLGTCAALRSGRTGGSAPR